MTLHELLEKIRENNFKIGVLGLGRVGLPLSVVFANKGIKVVGYDINYDNIDMMNKGYPPFQEEKMEDYLKDAVREGKFKATTNPKALEECDVIIITVGTPITKTLQPDLSQIYSSLDNIIVNDIKDKIIILRSTSIPNMLDDIIIPYLERKTGLKAGSDFGLAVCPERIAEGRAIIEIEELPEVVGGMNKISADITAEVFRKINPNKDITFLSPRAAALVKLFNNVYRYAQFALANEFALVAERYGEDAFEIIRAANYNYVRADIPIPGLVGGPCLSKDGYYLVSNSSFPDFVVMAWRLNESLPGEIVERVKKELEKKGRKLVGSKIGVLGLAFKANVDDVKESPALKIVEILKSNGAEIFVHDPYVPNKEARKHGIQLHDLDTTINSVDALILAMNHRDYKELDRKIEESGNDVILFDCWGMFNPNGFKNVRYVGLGRGNSQ